MTVLLPLLQDSKEDIRLATTEAIGKVVELIKDPVVAKEVLTVLLPLLQDSKEDIKLATTEAIGKVVEFIKDSAVAKEVLIVLLPLFEDGDYIVKHATTGAICKVVESIKDSAVAKEALAILLPLFKDGDWPVRLAVVNVIGKLVESIKDSTVAKEALTVLLPLLQYGDGGVRHAAVEAISKVVESIKDSTVAKEALIVLLPLLKYNDWHVKYVTIEAICKVVESIKDPIVAKEVLTVLSPLLQDGESYIRHAVVKAIGKVIESIKDPTFAKEALTALLPLLKYSDWHVKQATTEAIGTVVESIKDLTVAKEAFTVLLPFLKVRDEDIKRAASHAITNILTSLSIQNVSSYLKHNVLSVRKIAINVLTTKLADLPAEKDLTLIITILKEIIAYEPEEGERKELIQSAKKVLLVQQAYVDNETISWVLEKFNELFKSSNSAKDFLKVIYRKALGDMVRSESASKFIIACIKHGFTTSIIQDSVLQSYQLIFEDKTYTLDGVENRKYIEEIAQAILNEQNNNLTTSYRDYRPLFINSGIGLARSALDIRDVASLVPGTQLTQGEWQLTFMQESNNLQTKPTNIFILLEKRDVFGKQIIDKVNNDLIVQSHVIHPDQAKDSKFCETVFGGMIYKDQYSVYHITRTIISEQEKDMLFGSIQKGEVRDLKAAIKTVPTLADKIGLDLEWNEYIKQATLYHKEDLFKLSENETAKIRAVCKVINNENSLNGNEPSNRVENLKAVCCVLQ